MSQSYLWPAGLAGGSSTNPANGTPGSAAPSTATEVAGVDGGGILRALSADTSGNLNVNVLSLSPISGSVTANQGTAAAIGSAWPVTLTDGTNTNSFTGSSLDTNVTASALPTGAATQATLAAISGQLPSTLGINTAAGSLSVALASDGTLPLPAGAATEATLSTLNAKTAAALVPTAFDYITLTYVPSGAGVGQVATAVYKTGGSGGSTVATLTMAYDGSDRLASVTKT